MAIKGVSVSMKFRANRGAPQEVADAVLAGFIEFGQDVVAFAVKNHPYQDRTGTNSRSIGWAASRMGESGFGPIATSGGSRSSAGSGGSPVNSPNLLIATTSGYGGFLETGTSRMKPYPYIIPAIQANKPRLKRALTGVL